MGVSLMGSLVIGVAAALIITTLARTVGYQRNEYGHESEEPTYRVVRGKGYWLGMILALVFTSVPGMVIFHFAHYFSSREPIGSTEGQGKAGTRWENHPQPGEDGGDEQAQTLGEALPEYERYWMMGYEAHYAEESYSESCGESNPLVYQAWRLGKEYAVKEIMQESERRKKATDQR